MHHFQNAGYEPQAPGWPGDGDTVAASRANPDAIAGHSIEDVVTQFASIIEHLPSAPIAIGQVRHLVGMAQDAMAAQDVDLAMQLLVGAARREWIGGNDGEPAGTRPHQPKHAHRSTKDGNWC